MKHLDKPLNAFKEIWYIFKVNNEIKFYSVNYIFLYKNQNIISKKNPDKFYSIFKYKQKLYLQKKNFTIKKLSNSKDDTNIHWNNHFDKKYIMFMLSFNNKLIVGTYQNGLYLYENSKFKQIGNTIDFKSFKINTAMIKGNTLIIGTYRNGVYLLDKNFMWLKK